ncbi:MAG: HNH endonuclease [Tissierellales bacterium]|nr:HNH endonuclease [Tissierellales bacterium]
MADNRREFSNNEKMLLFNEVGGRCPLCGKVLSYKKKKNIYKAFEVAHIYPANPRPEEEVLLENEGRLSEDVNDLKNVIAVCRICHKKFDTPRTIEEYRQWMRLKRKLLQDAAIRDTYEIFNIEEDIKVILEKLNDEKIEVELVQLSYDSLKIDEKANETLPFAIKRTVKNDVVDYFDYIRRNFISMNQEQPYKFETLASQVKTFYLKCMQINQNQERVYDSLVEWLNEKTNGYSKRACEIVIAFFIQDCEVFS